jgi:uncharacterized damage-inducible protein DinB
MSKSTLLEMLKFVREKTISTFDAIGKEADPRAALLFRPGPGRATLGWQLMHIAATDDRHLNVRLNQKEVVRPDYVKRFAVGSVPDDDPVTLEEIRQYLDTGRAGILAYFEKVPEDQFGNKPHDQAPFTYHEWLKVLAWHEAHHQGQAHLTLNLHKARS